MAAFKQKAAFLFCKINRPASSSAVIKQKFCRIFKLIIILLSINSVHNSTFCPIHLKSYLCKNFGFQSIGMKRESGVTPGLSPQL